MHRHTIFLTGARASGKTTVGRLLAAALGWEFADTDALLTAAAGLPVADIVAREGWEGFRARERAALRQAAAPRTVVSTGGGAVLDADNRRFMRATGLVVYLRAPAAILAARLAAQALDGQRPSLTGGDPAAEVAAVLRQREALYAEAHTILDATRPLQEIVEGIMKQGRCPWPRGSNQGRCP